MPKGKSYRAWRAADITIPNGSDSSSVFRLLEAPETSPMVVTCIAVYGTPTSIVPYWFLVPPGQFQSNPYTITATAPVYCCGGMGSTPVAGTQAEPILAFACWGVKAGQVGSPFIIPAGWTLGVMPDASVDADWHCTAVGVLSNASN